VLDLSSLTITAIVAWWGAVVATLVLVWDVYKWRKRGADIRVEASPNMHAVPALPGTDGKSYVFVAAVNHGSQSTTITHLLGIYFPSLYQKLVRRGGQQFFVATQIFGPALPHVLQPGERWTGGIDQDQLERDYPSKGRLYCGVVHSTSKKPIYKRVRLGRPAA